MKKYLIPTVAVLVVLVVVLAAFGQAERGSQRRPRMSQEERLKVIEAIETQLAKLKEAPQMQRPTGGFADMSEEERTKFREQMMEVRQEQQKVFQTILAQVYRLQGRRPPEEEGVQYVIVNTIDLKSIQESATKEKATETGQLIERLIARASGQGRYRGGQRGSGQ
jgi:uncharacterized membrane protein